MSDRAIPRSYRMMQGFGVHTFRLHRALFAAPRAENGATKVNIDGAALQQLLR
jgi:hypothetical protein